MERATIFVVDSSSDDERSPAVLIVPINESNPRGNRKKKNAKKKSAENFLSKSAPSYARPTEASFVKSSPAAIPPKQTSGKHKEEKMPFSPPHKFQKGSTKSPNPSVGKPQPRKLSLVNEPVVRIDSDEEDDHFSPPRSRYQPPPALPGRRHTNPHAKVSVMDPHGEARAREAAERQHRLEQEELERALLASLAIATVEEGDESVVEVVVIEEEEAVQEEGATKVQQRAPAVKSHSNPVTPVRTSATSAGILSRKADAQRRKAKKKQIRRYSDSNSSSSLFFDSDEGDEEDGGYVRTSSDAAARRPPHMEDEVERAIRLSLEEERRRLIAEQEKEFEESLAKDRIKEEQAAAERRLSDQLETEKEKVRNRRKRALSRLGLEPPRGSSDSTELVFRLPDGARVTRRFVTATASVDTIYDYVDSLGMEHLSVPTEFELAADFPRRTFLDRTLSITDAGIAARTLLSVIPTASSDEQKAENETERSPKEQNASFKV